MYMWKVVVQIKRKKALRFSALNSAKTTEVDHLESYPRPC